jgi:Na+/proline symporter
MLSAKDEITSVRACTLGGVLYVVMGLVPVIFGMIAFKLYPDLGLKEIQKKILLIRAAEHLPPLLTTLFVSALWRKSAQTASGGTRWWPSAPGKPASP